MATITSTIKLVDQMTPTLNKISKAIDRVNAQTNKMGSTRTWSGFNTGVRTATKSTHTLYNALRRVAFVLTTLGGIRGAINISDTMMNANARLDNLTNNAKKTSYYMDAIYAASQRSRGNFMDMANSVGKLGTIAGDAFGSVEEMIAFTELMNKLFVISGASAAESSNAMYQLTQAMAAGKLQGDEMRSILENAPMLAQKIAKALGVSVGELKELGAEGKITADIIKESLFGAADDIEKRFENMPKTIGQTWTEIKNYALNAFRPVIDRVQQFINSPTFEKFKNKIFQIISAIADKIIYLFDVLESPEGQAALGAIADGFRAIWQVASWVGSKVVQIIGWMADNWSWLSQVIYAIIAIMLIYKAVSVAAAIAATVAAIAHGIAEFFAAIMAGQAWAWVILIIVALVAIVYLLVAAWNALTDSSLSGTGALLWLIAFVISGIIWLGQVVKDVLVGSIRFIVQAFIDFVGFIITLLTDIVIFLVQVIIAAFTLLLDAVVFIGDIIGSLIDICVFVGTIIGQVFVDVVETLATVIYDIIAIITNIVMAVITAIVEVGKRLWDTLCWVVGLGVTLVSNAAAFIGNLFAAIAAFIGQVAVNIWDTFVWLGTVVSTWGSNLSNGMSQLCENLPSYWEYFKAAVQLKFWQIVWGAGNAFNSMLRGASDLCKKMIQPFEDFANGVVDLLNTIIDGWNSLANKLTLKLGGLTIAGVEIWGEKEIKLIGDSVDRLGEVHWNDWSDPGGIDLSGIAANMAAAKSAMNSATTGPINWSTNDLPSYDVDWGSTITAFKDAFKTFDYGEFEEYSVSWDGIWDRIKEAASLIELKDLEGIWDGTEYLNAWNEFKANLDQTWDADSYINPLDAFVWDAYENPFDAFEVSDYANLWSDIKDSFSNNINPFEVAKNWYDKGKNFEDGVKDVVNGIGAFIDGLGEVIGGTGSILDIFTGNTNDDGRTGGGGSTNGGGGGRNEVPKSVEDLLDGYTGSPSDLLGAIADNTAKGAGSTANIEDTLDLAEDELELLRKIAEKEVVNRFTTAEIKVNMTNNNNVNSKMDLDGIVTHLSNKLYEELGVVASGVHY